MKKTVSIVLALLLAISMLAACSDNGTQTTTAGENSQQTTEKKEDTTEKETVAAKTDESAAQIDGNDELSGTLSFWYSMNEANQTDPKLLWWKETIGMFEEKYPGINLEISNTPDGNQYLTKITTEIAAGNTPDMFQTWLTGRLEPFVTAGRVQPLNDFLDARPELKKTISPLALTFSTFGDSYYALPMQKSGEVVYYNKSIFSDNNIDVPKTYDEFMEICAVLSDVEITPVVMGNLDVWPGAIPYMMLFNRQHGNDLYEEVIVGKAAKFDDPAFAETGMLVQEMVDAGIFNDNFNALKYDEAQVSFYSGKAAMVFDGVWAMTQFLDQMGDDLGFFNFPMVEGGKGSANDYIVNFDEGFAISSETKNKELAEVYMEFLFSEERQVALAESGVLVANVNLPIDYGALPPIMAELSTAIDEADYGFNAYDNPLGSNMGTEFNLAVQRVMAGEDAVSVFNNLNQLAKVEWE